MIGVFDSGYGGLTILSHFQRLLPEYDYLYLGDNARAPYGTRSFQLVYQFTLQAVRRLFDAGCHLVILACNTASAKALRSIQQNDLPHIDARRRVLGVIRPTIEGVATLMPQARNVGVIATPGTVLSHSYKIEFAKLLPSLKVTELGCPMFVPLVENGEAQSPGADWFVEKYIGQLLALDPEIDTLVPACTHYPLLYDKIRRVTPSHIRILSQGEIVAHSLADYLRRHPEMDALCSRHGTTTYLTTETPEKFNSLATLFLSRPISAIHTTL